MLCGFAPPLSWSFCFRLRAGVLPSLRAQHCVTEGGGLGPWAALPHLWHPSDAAKSWHSTFQPSTALECGHAVQSCPDELLCTRWALDGAGRKILHLGVAACSEPVQLWGRSPASARGELRLVQCWHQPWPLRYLSPPSPAPVAPRAAVTRSFCPCRAA